MVHNVVRDKISSAKRRQAKNKKGVLQDEDFGRGSQDRGRFCMGSGHAGAFSRNGNFSDCPGKVSDMEEPAVCN